MQEWTQLWLSYRPVKGYERAGFFAEYTLDGFDPEHPVIRNALRELTLGIGKMLGVQPEGAKEETFADRIKAAACNPKQVPDRLLFENSIRRPKIWDMFPFHTEDPVGDLRGELRLMQGHDDRQSALPPEPVQHFE